MFNKKDPVADAVKKIMEQNDLHRQVEQKLCEELGIVSRKQLPHEHQANYDALLEQRMKEALHPNQQKLDVHEPEKDKLTAKDFEMLRARKKGNEKSEYSKMREKMVGKGTDRETTRKLVGEEQLDEISRDLASRYIKKAKSDTKDAYYGDDAPTMGKRKKGIDLALKKKWGDKKYGLPEPKVKATNEEMQDSRNPLPAASAKERIQNKLGTGPKSSFDNDSGMAKSKEDRDAMNKKIENLDEKMSDDDKSSAALKKLVAKYRIKDAAKEIRPGYVKKQSQEWYNKMTKRANAKIKEEVKLDEAAKSKAQQKIMGMALAMRRGKSDTGSKEVARIAADMPEKELEKFAKTKHKGLPEKVKKMDKKDD
jgi:hypothetical protein